MAAEPTQVELAKALQAKLLAYFDAKLADGTIAPPDVSTLTRLLKDNGWSLDPSQLPDALKGMVSLPKVDEALEEHRITDIAEARLRRQG